MGTTHPGADEALTTPSLLPTEPAPTAALIPFYTDDEWHALRRQDVTASAIAALFGFTRWTTPYALYVEKAGLAEAPPAETPWMRAGRHLEDGIARYAAAEQGWDVRGAGEYHDIRHWTPDRLVAAKRAGLVVPTLPPIGAYLRDPAARLGATPDRVILSADGDRPLEIKNVSWPEFKDSWERGEAPVYYWLQANIQCGLGRAAGLGWDRFTVVALVAGNDLRVLDYEFDPVAFEQSQERAAAFLRDVAAGREPEADCSHPATQDAVRRRYLRARPEPLDLTGDDGARLIAEALQDARRRATAADKEAKALTAQMLAKIGHHKTATLRGGWLVDAPTQERAAHEVKASTFRKLTVKAPQAEAPAAAGDAA